MKRFMPWVVAAAFVCGQGLAPAGDPVIDRLRACASEADDAKRLACYDLQIGRSKPGQNSDLGVTGELLRQKQRQAGITPAPPQDLSGKVVTISQSSYGKFIVTLDNGQVWAQQEVLDFPLAVGDVITVRRGALGVLWMTNGTHPVETRVHRLK